MSYRQEEESMSYQTKWIEYLYFTNFEISSEKEVTMSHYERLIKWLIKKKVTKSNLIFK